MSGPFATYFGNQRTIVIPISPQNYDRVTVTAVADVNFANLVAVGANSRAATRVVVYLHWMTVTPNTFPAAFAGVIGDVRVQFLNAALAVVFGPVILKTFAAGSGAAVGAVQPYTFFPTSPHEQAFFNAGLATATTAQFVAHVGAIAGAPSFNVEIGATVDSLNVGPPGTIGGADIVAQGANNPNAF